MLGLNLESIPGFGRIIGIAERLINIVERLLNDPAIKEQFTETGRINGGFTVEKYSVKFCIEDTAKTAIPAEIAEEAAAECPTTE